MSTGSSNDGRTNETTTEIMALLPRGTATLLLVALMEWAFAFRDDEFAEASFQDRLVTAMLQAESQREMLRPNPLHVISVTDDEVICYNNLGCYGRDPYGVLPEDPDYLRPEFKLYTQKSPNSPAMKYQYNCSFGLEDSETEAALRDTTRPLVFIAHGFGGSGDLAWVETLRAIKTNDENRANVIVVDWKRGARYSTMYAGAAANSVLVGRMAAYLCLRMMHEFHVPIGKVHFVGFSLGGQMSGFFAEQIFRVTRSRIGKITALDSAAPLFEVYGIYPRKQYTDFMEAVHTSAGNLVWRGKVGVEINYGHVDYYPNGGIEQPGCNFHNVACSHNRAVAYYIDALERRGNCVYSGHRCNTVEDANRGDCAPVKDFTHFLTMNRAQVNGAIYFLKTNPAAPFCISGDGA